MVRKSFSLFLISLFLTNVLVAAEKKHQYVLPVWANFTDQGGTYRSVTRIFSRGMPNRVRLRAFGYSGEMIAGSCLTFPVHWETIGLGLNFLGKPWFAIAQENCGPLTDADFGYMLVEFDEDVEHFEVSALIRYYANEAPFELINAIDIPGTRPSKVFFVPANIYGRSKVSYAIVNPSETEVATVQLIPNFYDQELNLVDPSECQTSLSIQPRNGIAKFVDELFDADKCQIWGTVNVISDVPIAVSALDVYSPNYHFIALPVEAIDTE